MGIKDDLAAVKANPVEPVLVPISVNGNLYQVEARRLEGTVWDGIVARCPARAEQHFMVGFDIGRATEIALAEHGRLLDADGEEQDGPDWGDLLKAVSGSELRSISAAWWGLNEQDPNSTVAALKKASAGGASTSSN